MILTRMLEDGNLQTFRNPKQKKGFTMSLDPTDFEEQAYSDECQTAWNCGNHDGKTRTGWDREYYNSLEDHLKEEYKKGYAIGWKNFYNPQCA